MIKTHCSGTPDPARICTSHVERGNLTVRMQNRRTTQLTNAFSKKWANHRASMALYFAWFTFGRVHMTLKTTPAVAAGLEEQPWTLRELVERITPEQASSQFLYSYLGEVDGSVIIVKSLRRYQETDHE